MNVGDYVRTPKGIGKINQMYSDKKDTFIYLDCGITIDYITKDFTEKEINEMYPSSPQIIDLVEKNDYVNGVEVINIDDEWITMSDTKIPILKSIANGLIKTIVTHEQMEVIQYRVEE